MIKKGIKIASFLVVLMVSLGFGQAEEMAETMRSNGKIFVVVGVILIIFSGILLYLFSTGKKVEKLERKIKELEGGS